MLSKIIAAALLVAVAFSIGMNIGPSADDVERYMNSPEYKAELARRSR